jgi:guanyl-specific ribonuclease Sa
MGHSIGFGKLEREMMSNDRLPHDVRLALVQFKQAIRGGALLTPFENRDGVLPEAAVGQRYYEFQVGQATAPTEQFPTDAGSRRLVALVGAGNNILRMYFTGEHYRPYSWWQLQYP